MCDTMADLLVRMGVYTILEHVTQPLAVLRFVHEIPSKGQVQAYYLADFPSSPSVLSCKLLSVLSSGPSGRRLNLMLGEIVLQRRLTLPQLSVNLPTSNNNYEIIPKNSDIE